MSIIRRGIVFVAGTISNAILYIIHSRAVLEVLDIANTFPSGPATAALDMIPTAMVLAIGGIQAILVVYLLGGLQDQRTVRRRPG